MGESASVTELIKPYRCAGDWRNPVLNQVRVSQLSDDNFAFLHRLETKVPGSWLYDKPQCGNMICAGLPASWRDMRGHGASWQQLQCMECNTCHSDRASRRRALEEGVTLEIDEVECTPSAVPNNDLRYEINKLRAGFFVVKHNAQLLWCPAKDFVALDALREDPTLACKKKDWRSRHDRQCGDLLGMLPLVSGMRMLLTDHMDRDEGYLMLKGTEV